MRRDITKPWEDVAGRVTFIHRPMAEVHMLRADVRNLRERGYVESTYWMAESDGKAVAAVIPLRKLPEPMPLRYRVMAWAAAGLSGLAGLGWLIYESRYVIGIVALAVLLCASFAGVAATLSSRHACSGVHIKH